MADGQGDSQANEMYPHSNQEPVKMDSRPNPSSAFKSNAFQAQEPFLSADSIECRRCGWHSWWASCSRSDGSANGKGKARTATSPRSLARDRLGRVILEHRLPGYHRSTDHKLLEGACTRSPTVADANPRGSGRQVPTPKVREVVPPTASAWRDFCQHHEAWLKRFPPTNALYRLPTPAIGSLESSRRLDVQAAQAERDLGRLCRRSRAIGFLDGVPITYPLLLRSPPRGFGSASRFMSQSPASILIVDCKPTKR